MMRAMHRKERFFSNKGFTLVELMIVIAIIGILSAIAIPIFLGQRTKAAVSEAETILQTIALLNEQYYADQGRYAPWPTKTDNTSVGALVYKGTHGTADTGLEDELIRLRPGEADDLLFTFTLESFNSGQEFTAFAAGKAGTPADGVNLTLNQNNEWGTF